MKRSFLMLACILGACRTAPKGTEGLLTDTAALAYDADGDGRTGANDCDELDASVHAGAEEVCDGVDNDCDGEVDEGVLQEWYADTDADGFGDPAVIVEACEPSDGLSSNATDCDDSNPDVFPGAPETCNGIDDNCDGTIDDLDFETWFLDDDGDGHGDPDTTIQSCDTVAGYSRLGDDCDDTDATVSPSATEICNGIDDNCDGTIDEGLISAFYLDDDADGYGDVTQVVDACETPSGYAATPGDCDDTNADIHPGAPELCNELDDDCDTLIDADDPDLDPTSTTLWYADADTDGYGDPATVLEICDPPSGMVADGTDCDDTDADVHPGATEICNRIDDDCDTLVDDDDPGVDTATGSTWYTDADTDGYGDLSAPVSACSQPAGSVSDATDCDDTDGTISPGATEVCNRIDDDCDTLVDDDDPSLDASTGSTWYADADTDGYGDPSTPLAACIQPSGSVTDTSDCDDGDAAVNPVATEVCNRIDDDCDTLIDDDDPSIDTSTASTWYIDADLDGYGDASSTTLACAEPSGAVADSTDCDDTELSVNPGASEQCNGVDDDCSGSLSWLEDDGDSNGLYACEEVIWLRTDNKTNNNPTVSGSLGSAQAAALLTSLGPTIDTARLSSDGLSASWLDHVGIVVIVGQSSDGDLSTAQAADLEAWVDDGGSLVYVGYHNTQAGCDMVDSLPSAWGITCNSSRLGSSWSGTVSSFSTHPLTASVSTALGAGGEHWSATSPAQTVATTSSSSPFVVVVEPGDGRVVAVADEWFLYNAGTGSSDISRGDHTLLVDNIWAWVTDLPL